MTREISMKPVVSSQINSIGYDEDLNDLYVEFSNGKVYRYSEVPINVFQKFEKAESIGAFFCLEIRGVYEYEKIDERIGEGNILVMD